MPTPENTNNQKSEPDGRGFFRRTRLYLLEHVLYHAFLIMLLTYISYTFFALFWSLAGKPLNADLAEANIWFLAASFVFVPVTYVLYTRTKWEEVAYPARLRQTLRVVIMYIQLVVGIIAGVTFALIALINLIKFIAELTDFSAVITLVIPSAIMTLIVTFVTLDILSRNAKRSLNLFRPVFFGVCLLASLILLIMTAVYGRGNSHDLQTMRDLRTISEAVNREFDYQDRILETDLNRLGLDRNLLNRAEERNYEIKRTTSYDRDKEYSYRSDYQLCADFQKESLPTSGSRNYDYARGTISLSDYHSSGNYCFKLYAY